MEKHKSLCGPNYVEEIVLGSAGCLSDGYSSSSHETEVVKPLEMLKALANSTGAMWEEFHWVRDGINANEVDLLWDFIRLKMHYTDLFNELGLGFLEQLDDSKTLVMAFLWELGDTPIDQRDDDLYQLVSRFETDDFSVEQTLLLQAAMSAERSGMVEILLDEDLTITIKKVIDLPLAGEVALVVAVPQRSDVPSFFLSDLTPETPRNVMRILEHSVIALEELMGLPFPQDYAIVLVADITQFPGSVVENAVIATYLEDWVTIAHEAAHWYWRGFEKWIAEGAADFFAFSLNEFTDAPEPPPYETTCDLADNIVELEALEREITEKAVYESGCNYALGYGMFSELRQSLDEAAFRRGFRNLYLALRDETYESVCAGEYRSGCYLREAFADGATPEQLAVIDEIVARRYYGRATE